MVVPPWNTLMSWGTPPSLLSSTIRNGNPAGSLTSSGSYEMLTATTVASLPVNGAASTGALGPPHAATSSDPR